jgi:hypothetical protein
MQQCAYSMTDPCLHIGVPLLCAGSLGEASVALAVRLQNGLLGEALFGLKQHLAAVAAGAAAHAAGAPTAQQAQQQHAQVLVGQLLQYGAANAAVHAVARMPLDSVEEQVSVCVGALTSAWNCPCHSWRCCLLGSSGSLRRATSEHPHLPVLAYCRRRWAGWRRRRRGGSWRRPSCCQSTFF